MDDDIQKEKKKNKRERLGQPWLIDWSIHRLIDCDLMFYTAEQNRHSRGKEECELGNIYDDETTGSEKEDIPFQWPVEKSPVSGIQNFFVQ